MHVKQRWSLALAVAFVPTPVRAAGAFLMSRLIQFERFGPAAVQAGNGHNYRASSRWQSVCYALQGLLGAWRTQPNLRLQVGAALGVVALSAWLHLSLLEWLWVSFAIGLVIFAELMNTAIEQTVDLVVGPRLDPLARQVKDLAASCVLVACLIAVVIGALTFGPHLLAS